MVWLIIFAAGVALGVLLWPMGGALSHLSYIRGWPARAVAGIRFRRIFSIAPSRDPDVHALLRPAVEKHLEYLQGQTSAARKELQQARDGHPRSLLGARRAASELRRAKRRTLKAERRLAAALAAASAWGFALGEARQAQESPPPPEEVARAQAPARRRRALAAAGSNGETPAD